MYSHRIRHRDPSFCLDESPTKTDDRKVATSLFLALIRGFLLLPSLITPSTRNSQRPSDEVYNVRSLTRGKGEPWLLSPRFFRRRKIHFKRTIQAEKGEERRGDSGRKSRAAISVRKNSQVPEAHSSLDVPSFWHPRETGEHPLWLFVPATEGLRVAAATIQMPFQLPCFQGGCVPRLGTPTPCAR